MAKVDLACGSSFHLGLTSPFSITPTFKNARIQFQQPLVRETRLAI